LISARTLRDVRGSGTDSHQVLNGPIALPDPHPIASQHREVFGGAELTIGRVLNRLVSLPLPLLTVPEHAGMFGERN